MSGPQPVAIGLTAKQRNLLERIARRATCPQRLARRVKVVLMADQGVDNTHIARQLHLQRDTVRDWRQRWAEATSGLNKAEEEGLTDKELTGLIAAILDDRPRPGAPATFTPEQIAQIIAVACQDPKDAGRPVTHWTPQELADEVIKRGITTRISPRTVGRFLKRGPVEAPPKPLLAQPRD